VSGAFATPHFLPTGCGRDVPRRKNIAKVAALAETADGACIATSHNSRHALSSAAGPGIRHQARFNTSSTSRSVGGWAPHFIRPINAVALDQICHTLA
jgi:hypothetical protein